MTLEDMIEKSSNLPAEPVPNPVNWLGDGLIDLDSDDELFVWFDAEGDNRIPSPIAQEKILNENEKGLTGIPIKETTLQNNAESKNNLLNFESFFISPEICCVPDTHCVQMDRKSSDSPSVKNILINIEPESKFESYTYSQIDHEYICRQDPNSKTEINFAHDETPKSNTNSEIQQNNTGLFLKFHAIKEINVVPDNERRTKPVHTDYKPTDIQQNSMDGHKKGNIAEDFIATTDQSVACGSDESLNLLGNSILKEASLSEWLKLPVESKNRKADTESSIYELPEELAKTEERQNNEKEMLKTNCKAGADTKTKNSENSTYKIASKENDLNKWLSFKPNYSKKISSSQNVLHHLREWEQQNKNQTNYDVDKQVNHFQRNSGINIPVSDNEYFQYAENLEGSSSITASHPIFTPNDKKLFYSQLEIHRMLEEALTKKNVPLDSQKYSNMDDCGISSRLRIETNNWIPSCKNGAKDKVFHRVKKWWNKMSKIVKDDGSSTLSSDMNLNSVSENDRDQKQPRKKAESKMLSNTTRTMTSVKKKERQVRFSTNDQVCIYEPEISVLEDFYLKNHVSIKPENVEDLSELKIKSQPETKWHTENETITDQSKRTSAFLDQGETINGSHDLKHCACHCWNISSKTDLSGHLLDSKLAETDLQPLIPSEREKAFRLLWESNEPDPNKPEVPERYSKKSPSKLTNLKKRASEIKLKDWAAKKMKSQTKLAIRKLCKL